MGGQGMKIKLLSIFAFVFFHINVYSLDRLLIQPKEFLDPHVSYQTFEETVLLDIDSSGIHRTNVKVPPGTVFQAQSLINLYEAVFIAIDGGITTDEGEFPGFLQGDAVCTENSQPLPDDIINEYITAHSFEWIPAYTLNGIQNEENENTFIDELGNPESGYDSGMESRYKVNPDFITIMISDFMFCGMYINFPHEFLVKNVVLQENYYQITLSPHKDSPADWNVGNYLYKHNLPQLNKTVTLLVELNRNNTRMRIYNGETKRMVFDLVKVSFSFYDYIESNETNQDTPNLLITLAQDSLEDWPGDIKISPPSVAADTAGYITTSRLRLRAMPDTASEIIATLPDGEKNYTPGTRFKRDHRRHHRPLGLCQNQGR
jgi:hypothetical protein